ncbi:MAG: dienelactone hydrolase family protein [Candidatus Dormibacteraceae bacterium]
MYGGLIAETVRIQGHGGDWIKAYFARPIGVGPYPGVVVVHHMPGWDDSTKEITSRFAASGYAAICPNLHYREGPDASPDDAAAAARARGGVPDERFLGDAAGSIAYLRALPYANGKVGAIGYCSGGRQVFLAGCTLDLDAAVDCYGAFVIEAPPQGLPLKVQPVIDRAGELRCHLLGLFGVEDSHPAPAETKQIEQALTRHGKTFEFHTFDGAGHGFFSTDRPNYRVEAANSGWRLIFDWFGRHLGS